MFMLVNTWKCYFVKAIIVMMTLITGVTGWNWPWLSKNQVLCAAVARKVFQVE